jgi:hypothetical protein
VKKLTLLVSALTAGVFANAQADISVSGSSVIAYQSADSNNNTAHGGSVSFGLSTTTDSGMTVSSGAGITLSASDTTTPAKAVSGFNNITFATGGVSITVGRDVGLADGVGDVGGAVGDITALNNNGMSKTVGITDDEGAGVSLSTTFGGASVSVAYVADSAPTANLGDIDGATGTGSSAKLSTTIGDVGVTVAYAAHANTSIDDTETGIALTYAAAGGTLSVGYENSTGAKDGNQFGAKYAMTLDGATTVTIGYSSADVDSKSATQTDVAVSHSLGGGVSVFGEMRSVSGDTGTDSSTTSNSTMAIGTSISF